MRYLYTIAIALALLFPSWAVATPSVTDSSLSNAAYQYNINWTAGDGTDSPQMRVSGMCSVVFTVGGSDVVELRAVPTSSTAASSGTLIGSAFSANTTTPTVWQAGTMWVKAVATTPTAGGSQMIITCSNAQLASTGEDCTTAGYAPYTGSTGRYKCEAAYNYTEATDTLAVGGVDVAGLTNNNGIIMEGNAAYAGAPTSAQVAIYPDNTGQLFQENASGVERPIGSRYDMVVQRGIRLVDITNEYGGTPTSETSTVDRGCMRSFSASEVTRDVHRSIVDDNTLWQWTVSPADADEWYLTSVPNSGDPDINEPTSATEGGPLKTALTKGTLGALTAGDWGYGNNDTLGYDTVYVFITATGDPDAQADEWVRILHGDETHIPRLGSCNATSSGLRADTVITLPGDVYINDFWCTINTNLNGSRWTSSNIDVVASAAYDWTESSVTGEFYLLAEGGGNPSGVDALIDQLPTQMTEAITTLMTPGTLGSLAAGEYAYGDTGAEVGFDTIYVKLTSAQDPDLETDGNVLAYYSDQILFELQVASGAELLQYSTTASTLDYSEDTLVAQWTTPDRNQPLLNSVGAWSSSFFTGGQSPGDIAWTSLYAVITSMYRKNSWNALDAECNVGIQFREPNS